MTTAQLDKLINKKQKPVTDLTGAIIMLDGEKKVGKSTFAANFDNPLFLDCEDGLRTVANKQGVVPDNIRITTWGELEAATKLLETTDHGYKTLVVDGMAELANYLNRHLCNQHGTDHINEGSLGYGKGKDKMVDQFGYWFQRIRGLGITLLLIAHDRIAEFELNNVKFDKRIPLLDGGKRGIELWDGMKPSMSMVLYASKERTSEGIVHQLRCQGDNMIDAGNPFNLPETILFDYDQLVKAIEACNPSKQGAQS